MTYAKRCRSQTLESKEASLQELQNFWIAQTSRQRFIIFGGFIISFLLVFAFIALAGRVSMALLYAGISDGQAGPIVSHLEQNGVSYEIRGDSIWVDESQRDRVRMDLAAENLPQIGGAGYEILDEISGFSTTSQMFDAAYWRAKEGELARTILSIPNVRSARVHLTTPRLRGYRDNQPGAASVTLVTNGIPLTQSQAEAMRFLISSAVPRVAPDTVTVIDSARGVIPRPDDQSATDREARMKENVERILAPHVGAGNAIVELNIELVTQSEQLIERSFDPNQRALISEETEELTDENSSAAGDAAVTAASNLPEQSPQDSAQQQSQRAETRQRANYEVGNVTRQVERRPGAIRRLSVAVLVNGTSIQGENGTIEIQPRTEQEIDAIRDLVAAAVGYDEARGDEITVKSMPFVAVAKDGTEIAQADGILDRLPLASLARLLIVGIFAIIALALTMRGLRPSARGSQAVLDVSAPTTELPSLPASNEPQITSDDQSSEIPVLSLASADFEFDPGNSDHSDPVARLKRLMKERQHETVRLLNGWIGDDERPAA